MDLAPLGRKPKAFVGARPPSYRRGGPRRRARPSPGNAPRTLVRSLPGSRGGLSGATRRLAFAFFI